MKTNKEKIILPTIKAKVNIEESDPCQSCEDLTQKLDDKEKELKKCEEQGTILRRHFGVPEDMRLIILDDEKKDD